MESGKTPGQGERKHQHQPPFQGSGAAAAPDQLQPEAAAHRRVECPEQAPACLPHRCVAQGTATQTNAASYSPSKPAASQTKFPSAASRRWWGPELPSPAKGSRRAEVLAHERWPPSLGVLADSNSGEFQVFSESVLQTFRVFQTRHVSITDPTQEESLGAERENCQRI